MNRKAFTLVELAIVIVIIGLLVGGVLAGQELIKQAKIRAQIKQFQGYDAATLTFKSKYGYLPGDFPWQKASQMGFFTASSASATIPPNGDGIVTDHNGTMPSVSAWAEPRIFFIQLKQSNLIKSGVVATFDTTWDVDIIFPSSEVGIGGIAATSMPDGGLYYFLGPNVRNDTTSNNASWAYLANTPSLTPEDASSLDEKIDNGNPSQGLIRAVTRGLYPETTLNSCLGATNTVYNIQSSAVACRIIVRAAN